MKKLTKKMQEIINLLNAGHIIWETFLTHKKVAGRLHFNCHDSSVIYDMETCLSSCTSTKQIHSSVMSGLIRRNAIVRKQYKTEHKGIVQTFYHYVLNSRI